MPYFSNKLNNPLTKLQKNFIWEAATFPNFQEILPLQVTQIQWVISELRSSNPWH
jgi:hypothetical protein